MAIIYSYPVNTNILATDIIVGSSTVTVNGRPKNQTKSFEIGDLAGYFASIITPPGSYVPYSGAIGPVNLGSQNLTANSIIKAGGTAVQFLMADGSVSTAPSLTGFVPYTGATTSVNLGTNDIDARWGFFNEVRLFDASYSTYGEISLQGESLFIKSSPTQVLANIDPGALGLLGYGPGGLLWQAKFTYTTLTANRTYALPNATGTIALTNDLLNYVPYTGATGPVNLGTYNLTANSVTTTIDSTISGLTIGKGSGNLATNTAVGNSALSTNVTGTQITAIGNLALDANTANNNTAVGFKAMATNTTGNTNTSVGAESLQTNLGGNENSAFGYRALYLASANKNNAFGRTALGNILTGNQNIGIGVNAGLLTAAGNPNTTSDFSIYIGNDTKPSLDNNQNEIVIGNVAVGAGSNTVTLGNTLITTTRLRGNVQGGAFVKDSGTASQYLMADGSVTTSGPLFKVASSTASTGIVSVVSNAILGSLFTDGSILKIQTMISFPNQTLNITPITYYINTAPSLVGATQIATFDITAGQRYSWMDRSFWSIGGTFNSRNFGNSFQTSVSNSGSVLGSTSIPATFYIIASMNVGVGDTGTIASILIEKS